MKTLPMNFDWHKAKCAVPASILPQRSVQQKRYGELVESILSHIQLQVLTSSDVQKFHQCGDNAYRFVMETFIKPMMIPYINMHKLDGDDIIYIANSIKQSPVLMQEGLQVDAYVGEDGKVHIQPNIIVKAIVDSCM